MLTMPNDACLLILPYDREAPVIANSAMKSQTKITVHTCASDGHLIN